MSTQLAIVPNGDGGIARIALQVQGASLQVQANIVAQIAEMVDAEYIAVDGRGVGIAVADYLDLTTARQVRVYRDGNL